MSETFPGDIPGYYDGYDSLPPEDRASEDALILATADNDHASYEANLNAGDPLPDRKLSFSVHPDNPEGFTLVPSDEELGEPPVDPEEATTLVRTFYTGILAVQRTSHLEEVEGMRLNERDSLTSLLTRRAFDLRRAALAASPERREAAKHSTDSVVMIDLDYFKPINDTYGHGVGDDVLKTVAAVIAANARSNDLVCRYGGEEFLVLLRNSPASSIRGFADKVRRGLASLEFENGPDSITASMGVANVHPEADPKEWKAAVDAADTALYHAKKNGRNNVAGFGSSGKAMRLFYDNQLEE